jgi:hypothetical protein
MTGKIDTIRRIVLVVLVVCISFGLSSPLKAGWFSDEFRDAKKAYQSGQNDEALRLLIIKLRKDSAHQDAIALFKTVLKLVVDKHQTAADDFEAARDWANAISEYDILRSISSDLSSISPLEKVNIGGKAVAQPIEMPKIDVRARRAVAIGSAAEAHYQKGVTYAGTAGSAETAATEFDAALRYVPDYKDSRQLAADSLYRDGASSARTPGSSERAATLLDAARRYVPNYKDSRQLAADSFYRDGIDLMAKKDFKNAVLKLRRVADYVPGFKDSATLADKAKQAAMQRVAVMPFNNLSGKAQFGDVGQIMTDRVIAGAMDSQSEFLEFVTREYVAQILQEQALDKTPAINESTAAKVGRLAGIHAFVFGKVLSITASYPPEITEHGTSSATYCCQNGQPFVINANWTKHTLTGYVEISGSFQIVNVEKGTIVKSDSIKKRIEDRAQWVTFVGDQRALEPAISASNTGERALEPAEQLAQKAIEDIAKGLATNLAQFFR